MNSEPISRADFDALMASERAKLGPAERVTLERYGVPPHHVYRIFPHGPPEPDPVYVVACDGAQVLFYDDTEDQFGTAILDPDGVMRDWGTWGDRLAWALRQFPKAGGAS